MLRVAVGMGIALVLAACGGKQAAAPASGASSSPEPAVASAAAPGPAASSADAPAAPVASPPSETPTPADTPTPGDPGDRPPVDTGDDTAAAPPPASASASAGAGGRTAAELTAEAQTAARAAQWGKALNLSEQALRARPDSSTRLAAVTTAALAACSLKNLAKARQHYAQLPAARQAMIRQRCLANGVDVAR
ncbi:MAG: hypothetical protein IT370_24745 [Deltaproteobacteria bacterium]|nr:hypothetical protein [Deltaproteobacteria bacterium]